MILDSFPSFGRLLRAECEGEASSRSMLNLHERISVPATNIFSSYIREVDS